MLLLKALKNRSITLLWIGQVLSALGDEVYRVAFIWIAVGLIGSDTGYLAATQSLSLLCVTLFAGKWADHWHHHRTLIRVDLIRGLLILIPVVYHYFAPLSLPVLWFTAVAIAGISGLFEPAMQAVLPMYCRDRQELQAANGLMSTTMRMGRVSAPIIIGVLTALVPTIHFFTINSVSFFISALSIFFLMKHPVLKKHAAPIQERHGVLKSLILAIQTVRNNPRMTRALWIKGATGGAWQLAYGLGIALLVKAKVASNIQAFGLVMGAYGVGNLVAALAIGNVERKRPESLMYSGHMLLGIGFIWIGFSPNLISMTCAAMFAAVGGPMNDTPFTDLVQAEFPVHDLPKIFRLRLAFETGCMLFASLLAPFLFRVGSAPYVIAGSGVAILAMGTYGKLRQNQSKLIS